MINCELILQSLLAGKVVCKIYAEQALKKGRKSPFGLSVFFYLS